MISDITRQYKWTTLAIGLCLGVMSVINYLRTYLELGLTGVVEKIITVYHKVFGFFLGWLDPYLHASLSYLSECCHISLAFPNNWRDVFVPTFFYFSKDSFVGFAKRMPGYGVFSLMAGSALALLASVLGGHLGSDPLQSLSVFVAVFILYEMLCGLYYSIFVGYRDRPWSSVFQYLFYTRVLTNAALGAIIIMIYFQNSATSYIGPALLLIYVILLGVRDVAKSIWVTWRHPREYKGQPAKERLTRQGDWKLGIGIVVTIVAAIALTIWSSG